MNWCITVSFSRLVNLTVNFPTVWDPSQCFQPFRDFWFPLGTNDSAAMHLMLANVALHLNALKGNRDEDRESMTYHLSAVRSVNRRLANFTVERSDGILGAILGVRLLS